MTNATKYLKTFFAEKNLPNVSFEVTSPNGTPNFMETQMVIDAIMQAPQHEQKAIGDKIRLLDFHNADVLDFIKHLGKALARDI